MKPFLTPDLLFTRFSSKLTGMGAASVFGTLSLGMTLFISPASASPDYFDCAAGMTEAGISESSAITACANARYPENLGACVIDVSEFTGITAEEALSTCQRSRRPIEVAECTIDIHEAFPASPSSKVLENCGRSLIPSRYGTCVVEIVDATEVAVDTALEQCIRAGYFPWQIEPRL
ncbi:MAG: hypothetical protein AAGB19_11455 [Cyanobacteria bacterium P01_F01_bin.3]